MYLEIEVNSEFKIEQVNLVGKDYNYYNCRDIKENAKIIISKSKNNNNILKIDDSESSFNYRLTDFDYIIFYEYELESKYWIDAFEFKCVDAILQYLDWRKINYEVRNA